MVSYPHTLYLYAPDDGAGSSDSGEGTGTESAETGNESEVVDELGDAGKKAIASERKARQDAERQVKVAQRELDTLRKASMSDQEKAVAAARDEGRLEALKTTGTKLVDAEVRAAAAGREIDTDVLLEGLDRAKFLDDNGDPDRRAIARWIDKIAPATGATYDLGQGARPNRGSADMNAVIRQQMRR